MQTINPNEITKHETFSELFPINPELLKRIEQDMREKTYDLSQPIVIGTWEGQDEPVCIDGHTRLQAALNAGLVSVAVWLREDFESEEDALEHAIKLQSNRRNMTDADLIVCVEKLDNRRQRGGDRKSQEAKSIPQHCGNGSGRSASARDMSELLNISTRKVEQIRTVLDHAEPEVVAAVRNSDMSVNKVYSATQSLRKEAESQESENQAQVSEDEDCPEEEELETDDDDDDECDEMNDSDMDADYSEDEIDSDESSAIEDAESEDEPDQDEDSFKMVRVTLEQYEALDEWTGEDSIEELVEQAIDRYLDEREEEYADSVNGPEHEE
ncbi:hypothetical protein ACFL2Q_06295 [Thermodesulfobacteriota bacterium]